MTTPFDDLIRTTLSDLAQEAHTVNLTPRAFDRAHRRRTTGVLLGTAAAVAAALIGAPLALAAGTARHTSGQATQSAAAAPVRVVLPSMPTPDDYAARFTAALTNTPAGLRMPTDGSVTFTHSGVGDLSTDGQQYTASWGQMPKGPDGHATVGKDLIIGINIMSETPVATWEGCDGAPKQNNCTVSSDGKTATYFLINTREKVKWARVEFFRLEGDHMVNVSVNASTTAKLPADIKNLLTQAAQNPGFTFQQ